MKIFVSYSVHFNSSIIYKLYVYQYDIALYPSMQISSLNNLISDSKYSVK